MREFNVLPTDERFRNLTDLQIEFILYNMVQDNKEQELIAKGKRFDSHFEDDDRSWMEADEEDFEVVPDYIDLEDINKQIENKLSEEEKQRRQERFDSDDPDEMDRVDLVLEEQRRRIEELDRELGITSDKPVEYSKDTIGQALDELDEDDWI
ncbi:tail morphogenetic protein B [Staphylococcus phage Twort]|uniref:Tail morphogenetic protein B n=2 Tax=Staphylococcus phage Twort (strain DSM 17442 / HER 48) TaxID=2908167 RepID=A0A6H0X5A8_BPTWO|nr:RNA polymerase beta subunit [Staphylococcus phage Twort]AAX92375.1 ORF081 [Staphylococcus phage Twort]QIW89111.1 tail morphogenetic protein B [Staphylococcus phage Twort]